MLNKVTGVTLVIKGLIFHQKIGVMTQMDCKKLTKQQTLKKIEFEKFKSILFKLWTKRRFRDYKEFSSNEILPTKQAKRIVKEYNSKLKKHDCNKIQLHKDEVFIQCPLVKNQELKEYFTDMYISQYGNMIRFNKKKKRYNILAGLCCYDNKNDNTKKNQGQYARVSLYDAKRKKIKSFYRHHLIALTWLLLPEGLNYEKGKTTSELLENYQIHHKDAVEKNTKMLKTSNRSNRMKDNAFNLYFEPKKYHKSLVHKIEDVQVNFTTLNGELSSRPIPFLKLQEKIEYLGIDFIDVCRQIKDAIDKSDKNKKHFIIELENKRPVISKDEKSDCCNMVIEFEPDN